LVPLQVIVGDLHGLNTLEHQPAKIAAMEALWQTEKGATLTLIAVPNEEKKRNDYAIAIPRALSLILVHDLNGEVKGLNEFKDRPPVVPLFFSFRIMVGMGMLMLALAWFGTWSLRGNRQPKTSLLWAFAAFSFSG